MGCSEVAMRYFSSSSAMTCVCTGSDGLIRREGRRETCLVEFFVELAELGGLAHDVLVDHERGLDLSVAAFAEKVEGVGDESLV